MSENKSNKENEPTTLSPDQVAVTYDEKEGYQILMPHEGRTEMPEQAAVLIAAGIRLTSDEEFYNDLRRWMEEQKKEQAKD